MHDEYAPWVAKHGLLQPYGKCQCGCGNDAPVATKNRADAGWLKGHPVPYLYLHKGKQNTPTVAPNPSGLCECGCGQPAPIAERGNAKLGHIAGQPVRFVIGHHVRLREHASAADRFWQKVITHGPDECWEWTGSKGFKGYGQLRINGRIVAAHRFSYELHNGPIPDGLDCLHECDNPPCTNPEHLFLGTALDNHLDMAAKGRGSKPPIRHVPGEKSPLALFSNAQVREFREQFPPMNISMNAFARLHGTTSETMRKILKCITYPDD